MTTPSEVITACTEAGITIATAESLTAGLVAAELGSVPGASAVLLGGIVAYAVEVKRDVLGIDPHLLAHVVSEPVAVAMAERITTVTGSDIGIATTGVAGPEPLDGQPPGTVWIAVHDARRGGVRTARLALQGDRQAVRQGAVAACWPLVLAVLGPDAEEIGGNRADRPRGE